MHSIPTVILSLAILSQSAASAAAPIRIAPIIERPAIAASVTCESIVAAVGDTIVTQVRVTNSGVAVLNVGTPIQYDLGGGVIETHRLEAKLSAGQSVVALEKIGRYPNCSATILTRSSVPPIGLIRERPELAIGLRCETSIVEGSGATQAVLINNSTAAVPAGTRLRLALSGTAGTTTVEVVLAEPLAVGESRQVLIFPIEGSYQRCRVAKV